MVYWNSFVTRKSVFLISLLLLTVVSFAQQIDSSLLFNPIRDDISKKLPPLEALIDSAIANSPRIKLEELQADLARYEIKTAGRMWLQHWGLDAIAHYGNEIANARDELTRLERFYLYENRSLVYYGGLYVRLPLFYLVDRKNEINKKKKLLEMSIVNREIVVRDIRQLVIETYNTLLQQQQVLRITNDYQQSSDMMMRNAENMFLNGEIPPEEYNRQKDYQTRGATEYALTLGRFNAAYNLLEELVGMRFNLINVLK